MASINQEYDEIISKNACNDKKTKLPISNCSEHGNSCTDVMQLFCGDDSIQFASQDSFQDDILDEIIQVETFSPNLSSIGPKRVSCEKSNDAFLYYSDDDIRINTLKSGAVSENAKKQQRRKTKISFEISPLLMMADMLDEFDDLETNDGEPREGGDCLIENAMNFLLAGDDSLTESQ